MTKVLFAVLFAYLKATLEAIAAGHPASKIDDLLPWNLNPPNGYPVGRRYRIRTSWPTVPQQSG